MGLVLAFGAAWRNLAHCLWEIASAIMLDLVEMNKMLWSMHFKTSARTNTMTSSDLELCLFKIATRAWLSMWNVIFLLPNLSPQMMADKTTSFIPMCLMLKCVRWPYSLLCIVWVIHFNVWILVDMIPGDFKNYITWPIDKLYQHEDVDWKVSLVWSF